MDVRLEIERGSRERRTFRMRGREMVIGRLKGCGLKIPSGAVSRQHCRLTVDQGILHVEDLDSANGTLVNGDPVQWSVLRPGDLLTVGPITFRVEYPLTPEAVDRILDSKPTRPKPPPVGGRKKNAPEDDDVPVAIPLDESQGAIPIPDELELEEEPLRLAGEEPHPDERTVEEKPRKKKKKKPKPASTEPSNPDYSMVMKDQGNWQAPTGENLRDLLAKLEDEDE